MVKTSKTRPFSKSVQHLYKFCRSTIPEELVNRDFVKQALLCLTYDYPLTGCFVFSLLFNFEDKALTSSKYRLLCTFHLMSIQ